MRGSGDHPRISIIIRLLNNIVSLRPIRIGVVRGPALVRRVFSLFRRFDGISVRTLLYWQDELGELEERLQKLDKTDMDDGIPINL